MHTNNTTQKSSQPYTPQSQSEDQYTMPKVALASKSKSMATTELEGWPSQVIFTKLAQTVLSLPVSSASVVNFPRNWFSAFNPFLCTVTENGPLILQPSPHRRRQRPPCEDSHRGGWPSGCYEAKNNLLRRTITRAWDLFLLTVTL